MPISSACRPPFPRQAERAPSSLPASHPRSYRPAHGSRLRAGSGRAASLSVEEAGRVMLYVPKCDEPDTARCEAVGADKDLQYPVEDMKEFLEKALDAHGTSYIVSRRVSIRQLLRIRYGVRRTPSNLSVYVEPGPPASLENNIFANCIERCPRSLGCSSLRMRARRSSCCPTAPCSPRRDEAGPQPSR